MRRHFTSTQAPKPGQANLLSEPQISRQDDRVQVRQPIEGQTVPDLTGYDNTLDAKVSGRLHALEEGAAELDRERPSIGDLTGVKTELAGNVSDLSGEIHITADDCAFKEADSQDIDVRHSKLCMLLVVAKTDPIVAKGAICYVKDMLAAAKDSDEVTLRETELQPFTRSIDRLLKSDETYRSLSLEALIGKRRAEIEEPEAAAGLYQSVDQAPDVKKRKLQPRMDTNERE